MLKKSLLAVMSVIVLVIIVNIPVSAFEFNPDNYDFGGETVTITSWSWVDLFGEEASREIMERKELAEEEFNCTIEEMNLSWGSAVEDITARVMAGESDWDIYWDLSAKHYYPLVGQEALYPVGDVLPDEFFEEFRVSKERLRNIAGVAGKIYTFDDPHPEGLRQSFICWNKDFFEEEGLPNIYELYEGGNWTWDKMTESLRKLTKDIDGDGEIDRWGFGGIKKALPEAGFSNNAPPWIQDEDGNIIYNRDTSEYKETLHLFKSWVEEDLFTMAWQDPQGLFEDGELAMYYQTPGHIANMETDYEWGLVPFPKGPNADEYVYPTTSFRPNSIAINAEEPEGLIALWNFIFESKSREEEEKELRERIMEIAPDKKSYEIILEAIEVWDGEQMYVENLISVGDAIGTNYKKMLDYDTIVGTREIGTAVEEFKPVLQSHADEILGQ